MYRMITGVILLEPIEAKLIADYLRQLSMVTESEPEWVKIVNLAEQLEGVKHVPKA